MVNRENYEEYLMLYLDGELEEKDQKMLLDFLALHPDLQQELVLFQATVLKPDPTVFYANKEALLKPIPPARSFSLGGWKQYSAAAALLALGIFFASKFILQTDSPVSSNPIVQQQPHEKPAQQPTLPTETKDLPAAVTETTHSTASKSIHSNKTLPKERLAARPETRLAPIQPASHQFAVTQAAIESPEPVALIAIAEQPAQAAPTNGDQHLLSWLSEEKQEGLQTLRNNLDQKLEKAIALRENLKDTQVALKLGGKELFVINF